MNDNDAVKFSESAEFIFISSNFSDLSFILTLSIMSVLSVLSVVFILLNLSADEIFVLNAEKQKMLEIQMFIIYSKY